MSLPCAFLLPAPSFPRYTSTAKPGTGWAASRFLMQQAALHTGAMSSLSPSLSLPGLHVFALAFALEVSVGKTNTVMALNNSNVLLPCTFSTCIGFQDLVFTWYFNSTEMVGGSLGFVSVL